MGMITTLRVRMTTANDVLPGDIAKLVKTVDRVLSVVELTGIGEKIGLKDIDVRLSDKPVP